MTRLVLLSGSSVRVLDYIFRELGSRLSCDELSNADPGELRANDLGRGNAVSLNGEPEPLPAAAFISTGFSGGAAPEYLLFLPTAHARHGC